VVHTAVHLLRRLRLLRLLRNPSQFPRFNTRRMLVYKLGTWSGSLRLIKMHQASYGSAIAISPSIMIGAQLIVIGRPDIPFLGSQSRPNVENPTQPGYMAL
jgi:hypothetical protein